MTDYEPPGLRDLVKRTKFPFVPGWQIFLSTEYDKDGSGGLSLNIVSHTPNSYPEQAKERGEEWIHVRHSFLVPRASYNERSWKAWIRDCYERIWIHEIGEFLQFDGVREFAPHHGNGEDPYRVWHVGDLKDTQVPAGEFKDGKAAQD